MNGNELFIRFIKLFTRSREKGQSLVEAALTFPIFLILIAGGVEVSQILITQNRVETAARAAARFAANGGDESYLAALGSVEQTIDLDAGLWDIWIIEATVNSSGDGFESGGGWNVEKVFGISNTIAYTEVAASLDNSCAVDCVQDEILKDLQTNELGVYLDPVADPSVERIAAGLDVVAVYIIHDIDAILSLNAMPGLQGLYSAQALSVMRTASDEVIKQTDGCTAFPIAVHEGIRSLTDVDGGNPFPDASEFGYPDDHPNKGGMPPTYDDFYRNVPQVPLSEAQEGYIFKIHNGFGPGTFGWLRWNTGRPGGANELADSLTWPGDSFDYSDHGDHSIREATPLYPYIVRGYVEPTDSLDLSMNIGDWVASNSGAVNSNAVREQMEQHVDLANSGRTLRLIVWDEGEGNGNDAIYRISGFIIVKIHGYYLPNGGGDGSWILAEFIRWDNSCGQITGN